MPADWLKSLHGGGKGSRINDALVRTGDHIGAALHRMGIRGPVGIDCMVIRQDDAVRFFPCVEVNPRYTMGRVALELHRQTGARGGWFFLDDSTICAAGHASRSDFAAAVRQADGVVFTTDPEAADRIVTVMAHAPNAAQAAAAWARLGFDWPD